MTKKEIYNSIMSIIKPAVEEVREKEKTLQKLNEKITSGAYSDKLINEFTEEKLSIEYNLRNISRNVAEALRKKEEEIKREILKMDALNPAEITSDAQILSLAGTGAVKLNSNDLNGIIDRNRGNRTMVQLVYRFAKDNNIAVSGSYIPAGHIYNNYLDNLVGSCRYVAMRLAEPTREKLYNVVSEGSPLYLEAFYQEQEPETEE